MSIGKTGLSRGRPYPRVILVEKCMDPNMTFLGTERRDGGTVVEVKKNFVMKTRTFSSAEGHRRIQHSHCKVR